MTDRDEMSYDVLIVGAGPAGLACAIRLKQCQPELTVCVLEKGSAVGAHSLSGAVLDPCALDALLPKWREAKLPVCVPAGRDEFRYFTRKGTRKLPTPPQLHNHGNFIVSLGGLTAWMATQAEALGVDVFAGFAGASMLFDEQGAVAGVRIGDMGIERNGEPGPNYAPGPDIRARFTMLAEGCRGSLTKTLIKRFALDKDSDPQSYALGFKELWQVPAGRVEPGLIQHSAGYPMDSHTYGGGFLYHLDENRVYVGYVVGLDYADPRLAPFEAFQQYKNHPQILKLLEGGEILSAGARAIAAGGWQSMPKLEMPGAVLIGDTAGTLNMPRIKGIHQAMRCGVLAAEHLHEHGTLTGFDARWRASPGGQELRKVRNFKPGFKRGLWVGVLNWGFETLTAGHTPWTLRNSASFAATKHLDEFHSPERGWSERTLPPRDRLASVYFAGTSHDEQQPAHLKVADTSVCVSRCAQEFGNPCTRFCPAGVYEIIEDAEHGQRLQINAANCVHCKACDIKDPYEIITWTTPEGGSGPNYQNL